uniref:Pentatricopeptide repeat-containing protein At3g23330 n=1 Tax=Nicotiana tabacum TaxID=4097 RepID=A0A1S3XL88_TOBAC|nr:putative pentatricopeptide repeat-containing protein At3g23330 [Nicotiana tomentosiformis]XP_016440422.1 PREDICTED: putative pentatricopeptide repeat-containing protein At3g23330 [Nicotiana tabacum]
MVHAFVVRKGIIKDTFVSNALIHMYANCGELESSERLFNSMEEKDVVSWTALLSAYMNAGLVEEAERCVQNGYFENGLNVFNEMLRSYDQPNVVTIVSILPACAGLGDLKIGQAVHAYAIKNEFCELISQSVFVRIKEKKTAVLNEMTAAYVDEHKMDAARSILKSMQDYGLKPDEVSFNTLLAGHARNGEKNEAYELLSEVVNWGLKPNLVSFNVLVSGFQQSGLSSEALKYSQSFNHLPANI